MGGAGSIRRPHGSCVRVAAWRSSRPLQPDDTRAVPISSFAFGIGPGPVRFFHDLQFQCRLCRAPCSALQAVRFRRFQLAACGGFEFCSALYIPGAPRGDSQEGRDRRTISVHSQAGPAERPCCPGANQVGKSPGHTRFAGPKYMSIGDTIPGSPAPGRPAGNN